MIFVTLGTHPQPMNRLIDKLDELAESGQIAEDVVVQSAAYERRPRLAVALGVEPYDRVRTLMLEARVIVTHGGPGSIMMALAAAKRPIVIPRDPALGEHVDDHQMRFVAWLAARRPITPVFDLDDLGALLASSSSSALPDAGLVFGPSDEIIARVRSLILAS